MLRLKFLQYLFLILQVGTLLLFTPSANFTGWNSSFSSEVGSNLELLAQKPSGLSLSNLNGATSVKDIQASTSSYTNVSSFVAENYSEFLSLQSANNLSGYGNSSHPFIIENFNFETNTTLSLSLKNINYSLIIKNNIFNPGGMLFEELINTSLTITNNQMNTEQNNPIIILSTRNSSVLITHNQISSQSPIGIGEYRESSLTLFNNSLSFKNAGLQDLSAMSLNDVAYSNVSISGNRINSAGIPNTLNTLSVLSLVIVTNREENSFVIEDNTLEFLEFQSTIAIEIGTINKGELTIRNNTVINARREIVHIGVNNGTVLIENNNLRLSELASSSVFLIEKITKGELTIRNNTIVNLNQEIVLIFGNTGKVVIEDNYFLSEQSESIILNLNRGSISIRNNTLFGGILISDNQGMEYTIENNTIFSNQIKSYGVFTLNQHNQQEFITTASTLPFTLDPTQFLNLSWTPFDSQNGTFKLIKNGNENEVQFIGNEIPLRSENLTFGDYNFTLLITFTNSETTRVSAILTITDTVNPTLNSPEDKVYTENSTGNQIIWVATDIRQMGRYNLYRNGTIIISNGTWTSGIPIIINIDNLQPSFYLYLLEVFDSAENSATDRVIVTVIAKATQSQLTYQTTSSTVPTSTSQTEAPTAPVPIALTFIVLITIPVTAIGMFLFVQNYLKKKRLKSKEVDSN